jgi:peroxiredoxin Q/BCP
MLRPSLHLIQAAILQWEWVSSVPSWISSMASIQVGDYAPNLTAEAHNGQQLNLADYRGQQVVVLFFYPSDGTPICTAEVCAFRDSYADFAEAGAVVIGISGDSLDRHRTFATDHRLPFLLVSDSDGAIRKAFGAPKTLGVFPGRVTYVIDKRGIVRLLFSSQLAASRHVTEALRVVKQLVEETV